MSSDPQSNPTNQTTMSDNDTDTDAQFESKTQFIEAVREDGAELDGLEYFTRGEGSATTYHSMTKDGEEEQVTKGEVEAVWDAVHSDEGDKAEEQEDEGPEDVHLGTFYFSKSNWDEEVDRETLEEILAEADWEIVGEVSSGGYKIQTER